MEKRRQPFNFWKIVEEFKDQLRPPVCNKLLYHDGEFQVMTVGGPNSRTDFHWEVGEEFFFQLKGSMTLRLRWEGEKGGAEDVAIDEGEMFLLPPRVYHSPQRTADSIGIVVERRRREDEELDRLAWFCEKCNLKMDEESFFCDNLEKLKGIIDRHYNPSEPHRRRCPGCGEEEKSRSPVA